MDAEEASQFGESALMTYEAVTPETTPVARGVVLLETAMVTEEMEVLETTSEAGLAVTIVCNVENLKSVNKD